MVAERRRIRDTRDAGCIDKITTGPFAAPVSSDIDAFRIDATRSRKFVRSLAVWLARCGFVTLAASAVVCRRHLMFKKFFGLVSLVGLVGAGTLGACTVETTSTNTKDSGTADAGKKETGPTVDAGQPAATCPLEATDAEAAALKADLVKLNAPMGAPAKDACVAADLKKVTDAYLKLSDTATYADLKAAIAAVSLPTACNTCLVGSVDAATARQYNFGTAKDSSGKDQTVGTLRPSSGCVVGQGNVTPACEAAISKLFDCASAFCSLSDANGDNCETDADVTACNQDVIGASGACGKLFNADVAASCDQAQLTAYDADIKKCYPYNGNDNTQAVTQNLGKMMDFYCGASVVTK